MIQKLITRHAIPLVFSQNSSSSQTYTRSAFPTQHKTETTPKTQTRGKPPTNPMFTLSTYVLKQAKGNFSNQFVHKNWMQMTSNVT